MYNVTDSIFIFLLIMNTDLDLEIAHMLERIIERQTKQIQSRIDRGINFLVNLLLERTY